MADDRIKPEGEDEELEQLDEQQEEHLEAPQDDDEEHDDSSQEAGDGLDDDPDREAIRARRREERRAKKQYRQEKEESYKRELAARDRVIDELRGRLDIIERRSTGSEQAQLEASLKQTAEEYNAVRMALKNAVEAQDGDMVVRAQERMTQLQRRHEDLTRLQQARTQQSSQPAPMDPRVVSMAKNWADNNSWYDMNVDDPDSEVVRTIDNRLTREGWNPGTPEYWAELDARVKKYLPHRAKKVYNEGSRPKPKSVVAPSGREANPSGGGTYKLSAERVNALKDAGLWNDPKQREEAIKRFREYDKQHANA